MSEETKTDAAEKPVTEKPKTGADYVKEAFECFLKDKPNDTEPLGVIRSFYEANASDELKAKCAAEGKTVEGAYEFMQEVARKAGGKSISDSVGLSICMHYFQDVPAMADFEPKLKKEKQKREDEERKKKAAEQAAKAKDKAKPKGGKDVRQKTKDIKGPETKDERRLASNVSRPAASNVSGLKSSASAVPQGEAKQQQYQEVCFDLGV